MITTTLHPSRLARVVAVSMLAVPLCVAAAETKKPAAATPAPSAVKATNDIIALPLNPTLPAGQRLCTSSTPSGLGYTMLRQATGPRPTSADYVLVNYIGYLAATGAVFDQGMQTAFPVSGVIPGFSEGLQMIAKTGVARICVPAAMGYGSESSGPIPANSDLVFQVELLDYKSAAEVQAMRGPGMDNEEPMSGN